MIKKKMTRHQNIDKAILEIGRTIELDESPEEIIMRALNRFDKILMITEDMKVRVDRLNRELEQIKVLD